jgi:hypothetical protein
VSDADQERSLGHRKLLEEFGEKVELGHEPPMAPIDDAASFPRYRSAAEKHSNEHHDFAACPDAIHNLYILSYNLILPIRERADGVSVASVHFRQDQTHA